MSTKKNVTLRDIAKAAGVSAMTVSLSLRERPNLPEHTRRRIQTIARELGYERDPLLSSYGQQLRLRRFSSQVRSSLAFVRTDSAESSCATTASELYWTGARRRATTLGFSLPQFVVGSSGLSPKRLCHILESRNVLGILVFSENTEDLRHLAPISDTSLPSVTCGSMPLDPTAVSVAPNHLSNCRRLIKSLVHAGYERIGFAARLPDDSSGIANLCAALASDWTRSGFIPPLLAPSHYSDTEFRRALDAWIDRYQLSAVVSSRTDLLADLQCLGLRIPRDLGFASLHVEEDSEITGICPRFADIGAAAVDILAAQVFGTELGARDPEDSLLISGSWNTGDTARRVFPLAATAAAS